MTTAVAVRPAEDGPAFELEAYVAGLGKSGALTVQRELAKAYDEACRALIGPNDVQRGEKGRLFKKKSAWRKLGRHFGISTSIVRTAHETLPSGDFLATVTARAVAPWGQSVEDVGSCCSDEETGRRKISVADAIATAATRATNRAISNLIAMGETSAEELGKESAEDERPSGVDPDGVIQDPEPTSETPWSGEGAVKGKQLRDWTEKQLLWLLTPGRQGPHIEIWQALARDEWNRRTKQREPGE